MAAIGNRRCDRSPRFLCFLTNLFALGEEFKRSRVKTVTLTGWRRTVGKDMSLVTTTPGAADLDPPHSIAVIDDLDEVLFVEWRMKRRPACARFELMLRCEE